MADRPLRRRRYTLREKVKLLSDFHEADGETAGNFAKRHRLPKSTFTTWLAHEGDIGDHREASKSKGSELAWKERDIGMLYFYNQVNPILIGEMGGGVDQGEVEWTFIS